MSKNSQQSPAVDIEIEEIVDKLSATQTSANPSGVNSLPSGHGEHQVISAPDAEKCKVGKMSRSESTPHRLPQSNPSKLCGGDPVDPVELKSKLDSLFCHFTWKPEQIDPSYSNLEVIKFLEHKVDNYEVGVANPILDLCSKYFHAYAHALDGKYLKALSVLDDCRRALDDSAFNDQQLGFLYVLLCNRAHINFHLENYEAADNFCSALKPYSDLNPKEKAVVHGLAGHCHLAFGIAAFKISVRHFEEAVELDYSNPVWHFLLGKNLSQLRRIDGYAQLPTTAEFEHLETAVKNGGHPSYRLILAQSLLDKSRGLYTLHGHSHKFRREMYQLNKTAHKLFTEVLNENPNCPGVNSRCGKGFTRLLRPFKDLELAERCYLNAESLAPDDDMVLHALGNFYEWHRHDYVKAKECYEKCVGNAVGNYGAEMNLLRLKFFTDSKFDPIPEFSRILERYVDLANQLETYIHLGSYYYFECGDLENAALYYLKAIHLNPNSPALQLSFPILFKGLQINTFQTMREILMMLLAQTTDPERNKSYSDDLKAMEDYLGQQ